MEKGDHLKKGSLIKIVNLKASLNRGLSKELKIYFPGITIVKIAKIDLPIDIDLNRISGFFSGEGCFFINIYKSESLRVSYGITSQIIFT